MANKVAFIRSAITNYSTERVQSIASTCVGSILERVLHWFDNCSSFTCHSDHFTIRCQFAVDDSFHQRVFVGWLGSGHHTQLRPHLIQKFLLDNTVFVSDSLVKLFPFDYQHVLTRLHNAALLCDRACSVDIVSGHHSDNNSCPLALFYCIGHFRTNLNTKDST